MRSFILALQFLTVFPVQRDTEIRTEELAGSMSWFPLVGALQGLILVLSYYMLSGLLSDNVVTGLLVLILVLTNGGLHLDGFADTVDGLAGGSTPEDRLRIMRDSATGAIGVVFLVMILLLKFLALGDLPDEVKVPTLFLFPIVGRWAMVPMACWSDYARSTGGLGAAFARNKTSTLIKATIITSVLCALSLGLLSLFLLLLIGGVVFFFSRFFRKKIGGVTGDVFGFQSEIAEVLFIIMVLALTNLSEMDF
ncbi:MAG: adenosylcobinamide-GDP ribazoletransferase [Deltaproteobacteria bacterium]|nr:adenosylcobinamide-GDP ribazoletransferase [Deltaproteobacteria bacterium]